MPLQIGKSAALYLAGYNFSGQSNGYDSEHTTNTEDLTCFGGASTHKTQGPTTTEASVTFKGFYAHSLDPDVSGFVNVLHAALRADTVGTFVDAVGNPTPAAGDPAEFWTSVALTRKVSVAADAYIKLDGEALVAAGLHLGELLFGETALTGSPFSSIGWDQGGGGFSPVTARYGVVLQVLDYTSGLDAVLVQTSPDDSTYTTRGTFPAITGIGGYFLELNTTLDRYIRIRDTGVATILGAWALLY